MSTYGEVYDIVNRWKLSKRSKNGVAYYFRICDYQGISKVVARITWHDYNCEDMWYLSWGNQEHHHSLENATPLGWGHLQAAMRRAETILNNEGLY